MNTSVFESIKSQSFPYTYHGTIEVGTLVGGIPSDPNVARGWLETKLKGVTSEEQIARMVAETMTERNVSADEALDIVNKMKNLNGFKRDQERDGQLYYESRQLKAALKEAVSVAVSVGKIEQKGWGNTKKWISGFFPEHVFVLEEKLHLWTPSDGEDLVPVMDATGVLQQFVHTTRHGSSIQYQEYVTGATFNFTVVTDYPFSDRDWGMLWTTGEMNGLGASRSQGYGTYRVTRWDKEVDQTALKRKQAQELDTADEPVIRTSRGRAKVAA